MSTRRGLEDDKHGAGILDSRALESAIAGHSPGSSAVAASVVAARAHDVDRFLPYYPDVEPEGCVAGLRFWAHLPLAPIVLTTRRRTLSTVDQYRGSAPALEDDLGRRSEAVVGRPRCRHASRCRGCLAKDRGRCCRASRDDGRCLCMGARGEWHAEGELDAWRTRRVQAEVPASPFPARLRLHSLAMPAELRGRCAIAGACRDRHPVPRPRPRLAGAASVLVVLPRTLRQRDDPALGGAALADEWCGAVTRALCCCRRTVGHGRPRPSVRRTS